MADALALRGDEGRGKLRKVTGRRKQLFIRKYPNGETYTVEDCMPKGANPENWNI